jgi:hypothetical protein
MASSFDLEVSQEDRWRTVYEEVMALYAAIKDTPGAIRVRRAEMRQGEVKAEPIDFIIDVELKAEAALHENPIGLAGWAYLLDNPEEYSLLHIGVKEVLGRTFEGARLGVDGDYRKLYFRVKNHSQNFKQEDTNAIFE